MKIDKTYKTSLSPNILMQIIEFQTKIVEIGHNLGQVM